MAGSHKCERLDGTQEPLHSQPLASTESAGLDAQSLRDMRERADVWLADRSYTAELARDVTALTDEVERLVGCVAEAERRAEEWMQPFDGSGREWHEALPSPYTYQATDFSKLVAAVHEYEAALADARDALERIAEEYPALEIGPLGKLYVEQKREIAREVLVRLNQESDA